MKVEFCWDSLGHGLLLVPETLLEKKYIEYLKSGLSSNKPTVEPVMEGLIIVLRESEGRDE